MVGKKVFFKAWMFASIAAMVLAIIAALVAVFLGASTKIFLSLILVPFIILFLFLNNRVIVEPGWNYLYTWNGQKMNPFEPGVYYLFPYFGFLTEKAAVPMNRQMIYVLSGSREGLSESTADIYAYGTDSDIEPETGSALRLKYKLEIQCVDPSKLFYNQADSYAYVAGIVELEIIKYVHNHDSEYVIDHFAKELWDNLIVQRLRGVILNDAGIELISFIPGDIILSPENEASRSQVEQENRKLEIAAAQLKVDVKKEEGRKKILQARLKNMAVQKQIASEENKIRDEEILAIKVAAGVNGIVALNHVTSNKKLDTILEAAKAGGVTYVDDSKGSLSAASAMSFAINANQNKP